MSKNKLIDVSKQFNDHQHLSDLLDDKVSDEAIEKLLANDEQADTWFRYNLVRSVLKKDQSAFASFDFTQKISAEIAKEPAISMAARQTAQIIPFWKKATGGLAIAASVAFALVFSVQMMTPSSPMSATTLASQKVDTALPLVLSTSEFNRDQNEQARLNDMQRFLNQINERNLNVNEQLVGGEVMVKSFIVKAKEPVTPFEEKIRSMKKPSEPNN